MVCNLSIIPIRGYINPIYERKRKPIAYLELKCVHFPGMFTIETQDRLRWASQVLSYLIQERPGNVILNDVYYHLPISP